LYRRLVKNFDYTLITVTMIIILYSLVTIGSATMEYTDSSMEKFHEMSIFLRLLNMDYYYVIKQVFTMIMGLAVAVLLINFNYEDMAKYSRQLYVINLAILLAVIFLGYTSLGAQRWIYIGPFNIQPSEISKLIIIIVFADFINKRKDKLNTFRQLIPCFIYIAVPMLFILKQPDLGTSIVFLAIMFGMLFVAGARTSILVIIIGLSLLMASSVYYIHMIVHNADVNLQAKITDVTKAVNGDHWALNNNEAALSDMQKKGFTNSEKDLNEYLNLLKKDQQKVQFRHQLFHKYLLQEYQMNRLITFINPESDLLGAGYHVWQSRIAIGSGGLTGKGLLLGTQSHYTFLPIRHTDFIFSVVGEEFGFIGVTILLGLYFIFLYRGIRIVVMARDTYGALLAAGVVSMFAFHIILNIGMTTGIMPVTGIPLPLFSAGGSNLLVNLAAIGVLLNVYARRQKLTF